MTLNGQSIQNIVFVGTFIGAAFVYFKSHVPQQTIKNLEESNKSYIALDAARQVSIKNLELKIEDIVKSHADEIMVLNKAIADLQGQIKVYKELPLRELADGMKEIVEISKTNATSNQQILETLQKTSAINSEDRDVLTNQDVHIVTEVKKAMKKK